MKPWKVENDAKNDPVRKQDCCKKLADLRRFILTAARCTFWI